MIPALMPSDPRYPHMEVLHLMLAAAVNRQPFSPYQHMPEEQLQENIKQIKVQMVRIFTAPQAGYTLTNRN